MNHYLPMPGLHVTIMSPAYAEAHTRRVHRIPDDVGLGYTPYTVLVTTADMLPYRGFRTEQQFLRWASPLHFEEQYSTEDGSMRYGTLAA